jgi:hypothetical protein
MWQTFKLVLERQDGGIDTRYPVHIDAEYDSSDPQSTELVYTELVESFVQKVQQLGKHETISSSKFTICLTVWSDWAMIDMPLSFFDLLAKTGIPFTICFNHDP